MLRLRVTLAGLSILLAATSAGVTADEPDDPGLRVIREQIYVLRHQRISREDEWAKAIRILITIGRPAVPELVRELHRPNRPSSIRGLGFTLREIGDPRAVPAMIETIPETLIPPTSDFGLVLADDATFEFMLEHDRDPKDKGSFLFGNPARELLSAIEGITGHEIHTGDADDQPLANNSLDEDEALNQQYRDMYQQRRDEWRAWWLENGTRLLDGDAVPEFTAEELAADPVGEAGERKFGKRFPTGPGNVMGPIHEFTLEGFGGKDCDCCMDFDRHRLLRMQEGEKVLDKPGRIQQIVTWAKTSGTDGLWDGIRLSSFDMHVWEIAPARWDAIDMEIASDEPFDSGIESPFINDDDDYRKYSDSGHRTFVFTTLQGAEGIAQLIPDAHSEDTVLRYRLWNDNTPDAPPRIPPPDTGETWSTERTLVLDSPGPDLKFVASLRQRQVLEVPAEIGALNVDHFYYWSWMLARDCTIRTEVERVPMYGLVDQNTPNAEPPVFQFLKLSGRAMDAIYISDVGYESLSVPEVREIVGRWPNDSTWIGLAGGGRRGAFVDGLPCIYAFVLDSGEAGVLQYKSEQGQLKKLTLRYRISVPANK